VNFYYDGPACQGTGVYVALEPQKAAFMIVPMLQAQNVRSQSIDLRSCFALGLA
jgi:hypothetical protein